MGLWKAVMEPCSEVGPPVDTITVVIEFVQNEIEMLPVDVDDELEITNPICVCFGHQE